MPIKKINVSFDIDAEIFMKMLQHGNSSMKIEVFGDTPKVSKKDAQKLLPAPERVGAKNIIMDYAKAHAEAGFTPKEVLPLVVAAGYSKSTHSPQLMWLMSKGYLKRKDGQYFPTAKGLTYGS